MTSLPPALVETIEALAARGNRATLVRAAQDVSARYRREGAEAGLQLRNADEALAYACARMPATYAAVARVLGEMDGDAPGAILDFGAGPGTATLAALMRWPGARATMLEPNASMRGIAGQLVAGAQWVDAPAEADVVIAAYVLNEMPDPVGTALRLWSACRDRLVLVDAGTPAAQAMMLQVRAALIAQGAHIHAPCPHQMDCPFKAQGAEAEGWCHFSVRLARTKLHKALKGGELGYEDEKFSYLIAGRTAAAPRGARIVGHPRIGKVIDVALCRADGQLEAAQISKRDARYKAARKARWGDTLGAVSREE